MKAWHTHHWLFVLESKRSATPLIWARLLGHGHIDHKGKMQWYLFLFSSTVNCKFYSVMEKIYELLLDLQWIVSKDERSKTMINLPCKQATFLDLWYRGNGYLCRFVLVRESGKWLRVVEGMNKMIRGRRVIHVSYFMYQYMTYSLV